MKRAAAGILMAAIALSACTTTTEDIHNSAKEKGTLALALPYSDVHTEIVMGIVKCFPERGTVSAHTYSRVTDIQPGRVSRVEGMFGTALGEKVTVSIDIVAAQPTGTVVNYYSNYYGLLFRGDFKALLQKWIAGNHDCDRPDFP